MPGSAVNPARATARPRIRLRKPQRLLPLLLAVLAGCSSGLRWDGEPQPPALQDRPRATAPAAGGAATHVVREGETLYAIARRYGLDPADLARWNGLGDGSLIRVGQELRLGPRGGAAPAKEPAGPPVRWAWPTGGAVAAGFGASRAAQTGMLISGAVGDPVRAAADGVVVYAGNGLAGYGELLIVKHSEQWLSAYGHNSALLVREGERVGGGQAIARMGLGPGRQPLLHFEVRRNGVPVDPVPLLPAR
ncbi:MAG: peptidoglycan DD-metalloendopeptidase family protein [Chromatiales bacterium]|nr:peptidoglycan DD-metalloendopeptidase family protein [Chromatiales bacterium]